MLAEPLVKHKGQNGVIQVEMFLCSLHNELKKIDLLNKADYDERFTQGINVKKKFKMSSDWSSITILALFMQFAFSMCLRGCFAAASGVNHHR
ncbi:hypothetical protein T10_11368 [Trichinella papuae]|uniref:Uncharacterized protein n=1 Tax=Trichinella papuae TaxID=268474 RepID=A0A0V1MEC2_9BILA|nr:hypothetical protein T10_11368 [Trichinella papuae]